jgi:hypothetical protein
MEIIDKHLTPENFRKLGIEVVITCLLPAIRETIITGDKMNNELKALLQAEELKNSELHKVIKAIGERKGIDS